MNKFGLIILCYLIYFVGNSQNNQVLYDFDEIPQTLLLNPGSNYSNDIFIGVPLLSGISLTTGVTGVTVFDIFSDDGENINDKIRDVIYGLRNDDSFIFNEKLDIFSAGIRLNNKDFLSFGLYQEIDIAFYFPTDIIQLFYEGTTNLNKTYSIDGLNFKADMLGVLHAGISHKVNDKFTVGGRLKLYSSVFNAQTRNNQGEFYTTLGANNIYQHNLVNFDTTIQTTGIIFDDNEDVEPKDIIKRLYSFENPGVGFDIGFTYKFKDRFHITGSLLDVGFIKNSKDVFSYYLRGNYDTEGIEFQFDPDNASDYWEEFKDDFESRLPIDTLYTSYNSYRPIKINASAKYRFGTPHYEDCYEGKTDNPYRNSFGLQLYAINRPIKQQYAATLFYERRFGSFFSSKITYTLDSYSSSNIGLGISSKMGPVNLYLAVDNLLYLQNLAKANSTSFQLGLNIIIDK